MKKLFYILVVLFFATSLSFSQYLVVDTAFTTDPGLGGAPASCIWTGGTSYGSTASLATGFSCADDFVVPVGQSWKLDSIRVFAYQTGSTLVSTFTTGFIKIFLGRPDSVGSVLLFADTTTAFISSRWSGVYRVSSTTLTNTQRPIMGITLKGGGITVGAGTYWVEYSLNGTLASGPFTPAKTLPGRVNPPNQNGRQRTFAGNVWAAAVDPTPTTVGFNLIVMGTNVTAISNNNNELPGSYDLKQNYPNPFNPSTTINFDMPKSGYAKLTVYNSVGQVVATLVDGDINAGSHEISFDASDLSSGIYMYKLEANDFTATKKMTLVK